MNIKYQRCDPVSVLLACVITSAPLLGVCFAEDHQTIHIGSRRELFVDRYLIDRLEGAALRLHEPQHAGIVLRMDKPWEGVYSGYTSIFRDGERFRMYYRGYPIDPPGLYTCHAESPDGIHWTRPELGLVEFQGSKKNNLILARLPECANFSPFLDTRRGVPPGKKYKAVGGRHPSGSACRHASWTGRTR